MTGPKKVEHKDCKNHLKLIYGIVPESDPTRKRRQKKKLTHQKTQRFSSGETKIAGKGKNHGKSNMSQTLNSSQVDHTKSIVQRQQEIEKAAREKEKMI